MSISRTDSDLSFALNLSISEQNLQRMVRAPSASWPASPGAGVSPGMRRKTVKLKVGVRGSSLAVSPRPAKRSSRAAVLLFLLLRVVTFAAAAAAALALARGFSRGTAPSGPLGGAGRPAALGGGGGWRRSGGGAAMALDIGELVAAAEGASSAAMFLGREAGAVLDYAALDLNLETVLHGASLLKGAGSLKAGAGAIAGSAALHRARSASWVGDVAAEVGEQLEATAWAMPAGSPPGFGLPAGQVARLQRLRAHLSPLSQLTPLSEPADCFDGDAAPETFPRTPVAAAGMLGAVLLAVASPGVAAGGGPAVAGEGGGGEEGGGEEGRETSSRRYVVPALPAGFDLSHATACAQLSGFAYSMNGSRVDLAALRARLAGVGMELVDAIEVEEHFAYIARRGGDVFLAFRGSCNGKNVLTDLDYHACSASLASFERESGLELPAGIALHRGFLAGWASLREAVLPSVEAALRAAALRDRPAGGAAGVARLHVTGHSMGGAIGQLASWEIAQIAQRRQRQRGGEQAGPTDTHGTTARHDTYTFAAPRVGNCKFARSFGAVCGRDHWALQAASDAVPHLPFHAWGFRHPEGVLKLGDGAATVERSGDVGDDPVHVRPKDGNWLNWALAHDMEYYMRRLAELGGPTASLEEGVTFSA